MSHSIKVSDRALEGIKQLQRPRETYSDVVERLLVTFQGLLVVVASWEKEAPPDPVFVVDGFKAKIADIMKPYKKSTCSASLDGEESPTD